MWMGLIESIKKALIINTEVSLRRNSVSRLHHHLLPKNLQFSELMKDFEIASPDNHVSHIHTSSVSLKTSREIQIQTNTEFATKNGSKETES